MSQATIGKSRRKGWVCSTFQPGTAGMIVWVVRMSSSVLMLMVSSVIIGPPTSLWYMSAILRQVDSLSAEGGLTGD
jgi:hypothetical protein